MADPRQRIIIKVRKYIILPCYLTDIICQVFRKYSHSLGPEALGFLEDILARHEVADKDVEFSIEWIAREYNKQDGKHFSYRAGRAIDASKTHR